MTRPLALADIEALAIGAWILGTGGGGTTYHGFLTMRRLYAEGKSVSLLSADDFDDDALIAPVSIVGAPLVMQERLTDSRIIARAVTLMADYVGKPLSGVMPIEIGGGNAFQALLAAAELGLPVADADAMGRAYPEAQMTSFAVHELQPAPLVAVDPRGNEVVISRVRDWKWMERIGRKICAEFGSIAATCKAPRTGRELKSYAITGTVSRALAIGHAVLQARSDGLDPIDAVVHIESGRLIFRGSVSSVERRTTEGFLRGGAGIKGTGEYAPLTLSLDFQNEWTIARLDRAPLATTPDLICVLDVETGDAIGTDTIRYGQRVAVIVIEAPEIFRSAAGLARVGPRAFGYDLDHVSVFA